MKNITIRPVKINDTERLLDYFKKVGSETDFLMMDENGVGLTVEQEQEYLKQYENPKSGLYLIAENENNEIVSQSAITQIYPNRVRASHIYLFGISVLKSHWSNGIASKMMTKLIEYAKKIGVARLELKVRIDNDAAISLYKKFGFEVEGNIRKMMRINNQYYDEYIMSLIQ
jgi:RimJ/RimL family protein N-acetyltransferase